jgi:sodium-dependent phosphate cotransporter
MIMGANVGTSVTCMLVSLAHMGDGQEFERAFEGSSVLFFFNFMTVIILLPLEITTGYLFEFTKLMLPDNVGEGDSWEGPVKKMVSPLVKNIIIANTGLVDDISTGEVESCSSPGIYPTHCIGGVVAYHTCNQTGVIACDTSGSCPFFFQDGASIQDDMVSGWVCLFIALMMLIFCLIGLVTLLRKTLLGASTQILYKATSINPYVAILIGMGVTVLVQSSSITSSTLVPLAGIGVLDLESMFPLVLGADIGTTFTALMAAMVSSKVQALQIALVHLFFNLTGGLIWYPIPFMRRFILRECTFVGRLTHHWRGFPVVFITNMYFVLPLLVLGISSCFEKGTKGFTALGAFLLFLVFSAGVCFCVWWFWRDGKTKFQDYIQRKQRKAAAMEALADDLDYLKVDTEWCKNEIGRIKDFSGHLQTTVRMEEGRPLTTIDTPTEAETVATEDDERLSTYQSCRSKPWKEVLFMGAGSIRSEL